MKNTFAIVYTGKLETSHEELYDMTEDDKINYIQELEGRINTLMSHFISLAKTTDTSVKTKKIVKKVDNIIKDTFDYNNPFGTEDDNG